MSLAASFALTACRSLLLTSLTFSNYVFMFLRRNLREIISQNVGSIVIQFQVGSGARSNGCK
jgi:hypothetical protein